MKLVRNSSFPFVAFCVFLLCNPNSAFAECHAQAGSVAIVIPVPGPGFVETGPEGDKRLDINVPGTNRLLCAFLTPDDNQLILDPHKTPAMDRYMMVEVQKAGEDAEFGEAQLADVSKVLRNQFSEVADRITKPTEDERNAKARQLNLPETRIDKPIPLGELYAGPNAEVFGMVLDTTSGNETRRMAIAAAFLRVKNRLVFAYIYSLYKDPTTIDWLKQMSEQWSKSILAANAS